MASAGRGKTAANPFLDDEIEDVDDFTFLNSARKSSSPYSLGNEQNLRNQQWEQQREQLLLERQQLEDSILQSSNSAVRVLYDTEQVGIATAEELAHQGEQLRNVDRKLDTINTNLKVSQKHLNSMKSIFGSIKSYFRGGSSADASRNVGATAGFGIDEEEEERPATELEKTLNKVKQDSSTSRPSTHPAFRVRGLDTSGFGAGFEDEKGDFAVRPQQAPYKSRTAEVEQKLDSNLEELGSGLGRLKFLAQGLGKELDDQNELLDNLTEKTDLAEGTVVHQNSQIRRILKK
ncbi:synaptosomal-associated protein 29 [Dermacentor andersoni]|uniref:synaptosomal-associated protein 29 n=1 Tax=Dermacentor andersoni TaxID=34620 RepID=UPI002155E154|nr:synaptosomal-associated protein 29-like [Dermacentor andersoni]